MTTSHQRIQIASACGWYDFGTTAPERGKLGFRVIGRNGENMDRRLIPDYLSDLNAMHEAEKVLDGDSRMRYQQELQRVLLRRYEENSWLISATALQRAEAFLRTLGKWEES